MDCLNNSLSAEIISYKCAECGENNWKLTLGKKADGEVYLQVSCNNQECVNKKKRELGLEDVDNVIILWDEFCISGQIEYPSEIIDEDKIFN